MTTTLKKLVGDAGAGIDKSHGSDRLYDVLLAIVTAQNDLIAQFNQLRTDYDAETVAAHTATSATAVTAGVAIE